MRCLLEGARKEHGRQHINKRYSVVLVNTNARSFLPKIARSSRVRTVKNGEGTDFVVDFGEGREFKKYNI